MASIDKQLRIKKRIENSFVNFKKEGVAKMTKGACLSRLSQLEKLWKDFEEAHEELLTDEDFDASETYFANDVFSIVEEAYLQRLGLFREHLGSLDPPEVPRDVPAAAVGGELVNFGQAKLLI